MAAQHSRLGNRNKSASNARNIAAAVNCPNRDTLGIKLKAVTAKPASKTMLVVMTGAGEAAYAEADRRQIAWAKELSEDLGAEALAACLSVLRRISARCEGDR